MPLIILKSRILITSGLLVSLLCSAFVLLGNPTIAHAATCSSETAFKMVVKTDNPGTSNNQSFTIPTFGGGYNYTVDINGNDNWSDTVGTFDESTNRTGAVTIDFGSPGTYTIAICGDFPLIMFSNSGDEEKLLDIQQWGDNQWTNMAFAFAGCTNMVMSATDAPDLSGVVNMRGMFENATSFNQPIGHWDISTIRTLERTFSGATSFNQPLDGWDTSNVESMVSTFQNASSFNQPLGGWVTSSVTDMMLMFSGIMLDLNTLSIITTPMSFNQDISSWETGDVTNMVFMFSIDALLMQEIWSPIGHLSISGDLNLIHPFNQSLANWDMSSIDPDPLGYAAFGITFTGASGMLSGSSMSTDNYDATLAGWSAQNLQSGVVLGSNSLTYCSSEQDRQTILDQGWIIEGDTLDCTNATQGESHDSDGATDSDTDTSDELASTGVSQIMSWAAFILLSIATWVMFARSKAYRY